MKVSRSPDLVREWQLATATLVKSSLMLGISWYASPPAICLRKPLTPLLARHAAVASAFFLAFSYFQSRSTRKRRMKMSPYSSSSPPAARYAAERSLTISNCSGVSSSSATWLAATGPTGSPASLLADESETSSSESAAAGGGGGGASIASRFATTSAAGSSVLLDMVASCSVSSVHLASISASLSRISVRCWMQELSSRLTSFRRSFSDFSSHGSIRRILSQMLSSSSIMVISVTPGAEPFAESSSSLSRSRSSSGRLVGAPVRIDSTRCERRTSLTFARSCRVSSRIKSPLTTIARSS